MRKFRVSLALALSIFVLSASRASGQTPPTGCTPDTTATVDSSMSSAPDVATGTGMVAWKSTQPFTVTFTPQSGNDPYPDKKTTTGGGYTWWWSCALNPAAKLPVDYTITFTANNKKIYGHIIIKPVQKK